MNCLTKILVATSLSFSAMFVSADDRTRDEYTSAATFLVAKADGGNTLAPCDLKVANIHARIVASEVVVAEALKTIETDCSVASVQTKLRAEVPQGCDTSIHVTFQSPDPVKAQQILTAVVATYIRFIRDTANPIGTQVISGTLADDFNQLVLLAEQSDAEPTNESINRLMLRRSLHETLEESRENGESSLQIILLQKPETRFDK